MKILALDIGDSWTGTAISDASALIASPLQTVATEQLETFISHLITQETITTIVVGYPKTLRGTESTQTKKIVAQKNALEKKFPTIQWILWDERLTSKQADQLQRARTREEKQKSHSLAAAFILSGYLESLRFFSSPEQ